MKKIIIKLSLAGALASTLLALASCAKNQPAPTSYNWDGSIISQDQAGKCG